MHIGPKIVNKFQTVAYFEYVWPWKCPKVMTSTQQGELSQVVTNLKAVHIQANNPDDFPLLEKDVTPALQVGILYNNY